MPSITFTNKYFTITCYGDDRHMCLKRLDDVLEGACMRNAGRIDYEEGHIRGYPWHNGEVTDEVRAAFTKESA